MLGVFMMGVLLGYQRQRYGTTYAIITHAVFNFLIVLIQASA
jgi:membrane protease YdiL (CAAX protease family)